MRKSQWTNTGFFFVGQGRGKGYGDLHEKVYSLFSMLLARNGHEMHSGQRDMRLSLLDIWVWM